MEVECHAGRVRALLESYRLFLTRRRPSLALVCSIGMKAPEHVDHNIVVTFHFIISHFPTIICSHFLRSAKRLLSAILFAPELLLTCLTVNYGHVLIYVVEFVWP